MRRLILAAASAGAAWAQSGGTIDGPDLGLLPEPKTGAIRWIAGIPGAATVGSAVAVAPGLRAATTRSHALIVLPDGTAQIVTAAGVRALPEADPGVTQIALSPRGGSAVLYFEHSKTVQVFTGLPNAPRLERVLHIGASPKALAVSDDAQAVLTVVNHRRDGDSVSLHTMTGAQVLQRSNRIGAAEFLPGSTRAAIATTDGVFLVAPDLGIEVIADEPDAVAVGISADAGRIAVASRSGKITVHDLRTGRTLTVACTCAPTLMAPLRGNAVFRLNEMGDGPVWLLDADSPEPRVHFVAAGGQDR